MTLKLSRNEPRLDMQELAKKLEPIMGAADSGPQAYAPPAQREDAAIALVQKFGDLPTREIDDIIEAASAKIEALKREAQEVRDIYVQHTQRITDGINRLREGVKLSMETMKTLREQCRTLDAEPAQ